MTLHGSRSSSISNRQKEQRLLAENSIALAPPGFERHDWRTRRVRLALAWMRDGRTLPQTWQQTWWRRWFGVFFAAEPAHHPVYANDLDESDETNAPDGAGADEPHVTPPAPPEASDFEAFLQRHQQDIFGYLWRMTGDEQAARDLCQETFIRAWQHFARIEHYERPGGWLFRVATNLALKHLRHHTLGSRLLPFLHANETNQRAADPAASVVLGDAVRQVLLSLAPRPRAVLVLHDVYGLTSEEVANTLEMTHAAARMMLCRAREQFRLRYQRQEEEV
jgi:RNA polymerase sigma-70 factor (ECF subfamily)